MVHVPLSHLRPAVLLRQFISWAHRPYVVFSLHVNMGHQFIMYGQRPSDGSDVLRRLGAS